MTSDSTFNRPCESGGHRNGIEKKHRYTFTGKPGKWIGAKFGFWCNRLASKNDSGWMQIDWIKASE